MPFDPKESGATGRARMKEIAAETKAAMDHNIDAYLAVLGRAALPAERAQAEIFASLMLRASRLRDQGRSDIEVLRQAADLMLEVPFLRGPWPILPVADERSE